MINLQSLTSTPDTVSLTATLDTALCVGAGGSSGSLADKPILRTAEGQLLIPASQVKGRLRHECEKLARGLGWPVCHSPNPQTMCPQRAGFSSEEEAAFHRSDYQVEGDRYHCIICQIFGNPSLPAQVDFDDLLCEAPAETLAEVIRPGVSLNRRRRTAEDQKLYFLETSPANLKLQFTGQLHIHPNAPVQTQPLLLAALRHVHALGGSKSAGLGWLTWQTSGLAADKHWQQLLPGGAA